MQGGKTADTSWVKLWAPRLMTSLRVGTERVAAFTAMSIDAALVFPHNFSRFSSVYFFFLCYYWNFCQLETIFRHFSSSHPTPHSPVVRLIAKTLNCSYRGHMKSQRQHHLHLIAFHRSLPSCLRPRSADSGKRTQGKRKICQRVVYLRAHNDSLAKELAAVTARG